MSANWPAPSVSALLARALSMGLVALAVADALRLSPSLAPPQSPASPPAASTTITEPAAYVHDHTPRHGGVVGMVDDRHVEALALADGTIRVYLTDRWRTPLALDDATGSVTVGEDADAKALALGRAADCLEARAPPPASPTLAARLDLHVASDPVSIDFVLPIGARNGGAVGVPLAGCVAPTPRSPAEPAALGRSPRCTLPFATEVTALAVTPDATRLLLAAVDVGTSMWHLPAVTLDMGLDQPPPLVMSAPEAPHREAANAIVVSPDSRLAILALEGRLILYALGDGKVLGELGKGRGVVRDIAWSRDGALLLVSRFYGRAATLLRAKDGALVRELPLSEEVAALALSADSTLAAVGTRSGEIAIFDLASGRRLRTLAAGSRAIEALVFADTAGSAAGRRLMSAGADGALRVFDVATGGSLATRSFEAPLYRLAVAADGRAVASGDRAGRVRVHNRDGAVIATLAGPREGSSVLDLAFAGTALVVSDALGGVSVWDGVSR